MIIYCAESFDSNLSEKGKLVYHLGEGVLYHFQNKNFGTGIKKISYTAVSMESEKMQYYGLGNNYMKRKRMYVSVFHIPIIDAIVYDNDELLWEWVRRILEETDKMKDAGVKDFDNPAFRLELKTYLDDSIPKALAGENLIEGMTLSQEIQDDIAAIYRKM